MSTDRSLYKLGGTGSDATLSLQLKYAGVFKLVRLGVFLTAWGVVCNCVELMGTACGSLSLTMTVWVFEMLAAFDFSGVLGGWVIAGNKCAHFQQLVGWNELVVIGGGKCGKLRK